jgi:three-Cys-motif partner protein
MNGDFHSARKDWSKIKHQILHRYVSLFLGKLGKRYDRVYYVDGFAGQGLYSDGSKGSAFLAAEIAAAPANKSRQDFLRCINVEEDSDTFGNLEQATAPFVRRGCVKNLHGTFHQHLEEILRTVDGSPVFFFIDPFGTMGLELETLKRIGCLKGPKEVLARYDDTRVKRLLNWGSRTDNIFEPRVQKTIVAWEKRAAQLTDEQAIQQFEALSESAELRENLIRGYERLVHEQAGFKYSIHYPIRNPGTRGHRYYLVHFSNFPDGYVHMANFMAMAERTVQRLASQSGELDFGGSANSQMELLGVAEAVKREIEDSTVKEISRELLDMVLKVAGRSGKTQCRYVYAAIVGRFGWRTTRMEWIKSLRALAVTGAIALEGTNDSDHITVTHR